MVFVCLKIRFSGCTVRGGTKVGRAIVRNGGRDLAGKLRTNSSFLCDIQRISKDEGVESQKHSPAPKYTHHLTMHEA